MRCAFFHLKARIPAPSGATLNARGFSWIIIGVLYWESPMARAWRGEPRWILSNFGRRGKAIATQTETNLHHGLRAGSARSEQREKPVREF